MEQENGPEQHTTSAQAEQGYYDKKEREQLLRERMALLESTGEGIYGIDEQGRCTFINTAGAKLLGYTPDELLNKNMHHLIHHSHKDGSPYPEHECPILQALERDQGIRVDNEVLWKQDGTAFPAEYSSYPVKEDGHIRGAVVTCVDITERKELEKRKDEFISLTSHELRTPITAIKGNLQLAERRLKKLLRQEDIPVEISKEVHAVSQMLSRALRQVEVQNRLINDLLDVSRIASNKLELSPELCDLETIVRETVEDQRASTPTRSFILELPGEPVLSIVDGGRIGQVLNNYLTNANKYSASTQPIAVGLQVEEHYAKVWVQDKGPGLSPEAQKHIWERFYQAPGIMVQSGSGVGLGLGLHICQTLIKHHGGNVGVESTPGKGSTFWFTLPLAK
ncbi:MAG: PAS domain-containing sensor histidine kinase [Chloroflexota bacterium]|nr:PAS domain-containing sensor histidine kinase [Chloroflexota bacterium]